MNRQYVKTSPSWVSDQGSVAWVENDPRSAAAMLRGRGDHRAMVYERFVEKVRKQMPTISQEQLDSMYATEMQREEDRFLRVASRFFREFFVYLNTNLKHSHIVFFTLFCFFLRCFDDQPKI